MHLNEFAETGAPLDMSRSAELASLMASAADLGVAHPPAVRYRSNNVVMRHQRFHYLEWGEPGTPELLFLHGSNQSAHSFDLVALHLADRFHIYALDQRGHGDSDPAPDDDYRVSTMADDVAAFAGSLQLDRFALLGHSMGGRIAIQYAAAHAGRLERLIIVDIGPDIELAGLQRVRAMMSQSPERIESEEWAKTASKYLQTRYIRKAAVYENGGLRNCPKCGGPTHVVNQQKQHGTWDNQALKIGCSNPTCNSYLRSIDERPPFLEVPRCQIDGVTKYRKVVKGRGSVWQCPKHPKECTREKVVPGDP